MNPLPVTSLSRWRRGFCCGALLLAAPLLPAAETGAAAPVLTMDALAAHARDVLREIEASEHSWVRIHAAEALMAGGASDAVRAEFLASLPTLESSAIRVGAWRVLTTTAPSPEDREPWIVKIARTYLDPAAADQNQAIETLCKLGFRVSGEVLAKVRREAAGPPSVPMSLALWSAVLAGEPDALPRLTALLASSDPALRGDAAYALRWLRLSDPAMRRALTRAAAAEPAGTSAYPYILGAALTVDADPTQTAAWTAKLNEVFLASGPTDGRFEASWTLRNRYRVADLPRLAAMLDLPPKENDTRVGAAAVILVTLGRR
jgi:hypothetical protein